MSNVEGFLFKRGQERSGFGLTVALSEKRKWCVLDVESKQLLIYKEPPSGSSGRANIIELATARKVDAERIGAGIFEIVTPHRVFHLRAKDEEEAWKWVLATRATVIEAASQPGTTSCLYYPSSLDTVFTVTTIGDRVSRSPSTCSLPVNSRPDIPTPLQSSLPVQMRDAAPWCIEAVWLHGQEDVPLDINAHLGELPADCSFDARVRLSDGTTYVVDSEHFDLAGGERCEIAAAGVSKLFAQLVPENVDKSASPPRVPPTCDAADLQARTHPARDESVRVLCTLVAAACCCGGSLVSILARGVGRKRRIFCGVLLAAASWALARSLKILAAALRAKASEASSSSSSSSADGRQETPPTSRRKLVLRAVTEMPSRSCSAAMPHSLRPPESFLKRTGDAIAVDVPKGAVDFSGRWRLSVARSSDPSEMLKALGVPWIARKALAGVSRVVEIEQTGLSFTDTTTTAMFTKTISFALDGSSYSEMSPVDKTMITMCSKYEEDGQCIVTYSKYSDGVRSQEVRRYLLEGGETYHIFNTLSLGTGSDIVTHTFFSKET